MSAPAAGGPWRVLILDRAGDDPKWILCSVTLPGDVRPAQLGEAGRYASWDEVTAWVRETVGQQVSLVPLHSPLAWTVEDGRR